MSKMCETESCNVEIIEAWSHCAKCHRRIQRRKKVRKAQQKGKSKVGTRQPLLDAQGKVRANMGLSRLKELDRQRWLAEHSVS